MDRIKDSKLLWYILTFIFSFGTTFGTIKVTTNYLESRVSRLENKTDNIDAMKADISNIKQSQTEIKEQVGQMYKYLLENRRK